MTPCPADRGFTGVSPETEKCNVCGYVVHIFSSHEHNVEDAGQQAVEDNHRLAELIAQRREPKP